MKTKKKNGITRWALIAALGLLTLLIGGAIYAQGGAGMRQGNPDMGGGGFRQHMGGGPGGPGMGPGMMLMQDREIMTLMGQIKLIDTFNKIDLTKEQASKLLNYSREIQSITEKPMDETRAAIISQLERVRGEVLKGGEFDRESIHEVFERFKNDRDPEAIREQCKPIIEEAMKVFTDEQVEKMKSMAQDRFENMGGGMRGEDRPGGRMDDRGFGDKVKERMENRDRDFQGPGKGLMLGFILMQPGTTEALELYINAR